MGEVAVCILIHGNPNYFRTGKQAALSVLEQTDFDLFLALGSGPPLRFFARSRIYCHPLPEETEPGYRARPFLRKFYALQSCLERLDHSWLILLDADAIMVQPFTKQMVVESLADRGIGMVAQRTILGSGMGRRDFLTHYVDHSLAWLAPDAVPPQLEAFRFYNSGVVVGKREELTRFLRWAQETLSTRVGSHNVGKHMIADQDYFQFWTNNLHPESSVSLPWSWNHCEHWDEAFPRKEAKILHFSNFCQGPSLWQAMRMNMLRRGLIDPRIVKSLMGRRINYR
jgi:hypothetical protein